MSLLGLDRLKERDRKALFLGLVLIGPMLVWMAGVRPYRAALAEASDRVAAERSLLVRERALLESAHELEKSFEKASARAERAEGRLVNAANRALAEAELSDYLEVAAVNSRVLLQEIRTVAPPREQEVPDGMEPLRLSIRGESDLEGVLTFLRTVETSPLLLRVGTLSLEPVMERGEAREGAPPEPARATGVVSFTLVLEGFTWPVGSQRPEGGETTEVGE